MRRCGFARQCRALECLEPGPAKKPAVAAGDVVIVPYSFFFWVSSWQIVLLPLSVTTGRTFVNSVQTAENYDSLAEKCEDLKHDIKCAKDLTRI